MNRKIFITTAVAVLVILTIIVVGIVWHVRSVARGQEQQRKGQEQVQKVANDGEARQNRETKNFVIDVDQNIGNWQTKEVEFFTIKFPKEWYWLEVSRPSSEYGRSSIITNNPNHHLSYPDIGMFDDITNDTEVVITDWGTPTSNSGTPRDGLDYLIKMAREVDSTAKCVYPSDISVFPFIASCTVKKENHQKVEEYYIINNKISLVLSAATTNDTLVSNSILEKIAKSIILK